MSERSQLGTEADNQPREKQCTKCKTVKPVSEFYPDKYTRSGLNCRCKDCVKAIARKGHYERPEHVKERKRIKEREAAARARNRQSTTAWRQNHPEKKRAHHLLNNAIRDGRMVRGDCEKCGAPKAQAHHHDYSKPFDVHWLCRRCHGAEHRTSPEGIAMREAGQ